MPRAPKICSAPRCPNLQPCPTHRKVPWQGSTRSQRLPPGWSRIRARVLRRDPICRACGIEPATDVDHIEAGDNHDESNLQGLCASCHRTKTQGEANAARRAQGGYPQGV